MICLYVLFAPKELIQAVTDTEDLDYHLGVIAQAANLDAEEVQVFFLRGLQTTSDKVDEISTNTIWVFVDLLAESSTRQKKLIKEAINAVFNFLANQADIAYQPPGITFIARPKKPGAYVLEKLVN